MWCQGGKILKFICCFYVLGAAVWAQEEAPSLWDLLPEPSPTSSSLSLSVPAFSEFDLLQLEDVLADFVPRPIARRAVQLAAAARWDEVEVILRRFQLTSFEALESARGSRAWSSQRLALTLYFFSQLETEAVWSGHARPDNLGFFQEPRSILERSGRLEAQHFHRHGLNAQWAVLLGLSQNAQVQHFHPELRTRYSYEVYVRELIRVAEAGDHLGLQAALLASLVNSQSTRRLNENQMRRQSELRTYRFESRLSDGIFQLLSLDPDQLRDFVLSGELPSDFVVPKAKSFERLVHSFKTENVKRQMKLLSEVCRGGTSRSSFSP